MQMPDWVDEFDGAVTVCDRAGIILYMNAKAAAIFQDDGGTALVGTNVLDCHPEPARSKLVAMMAEERQNVYTIEKAGRKKLIFQAPWHRDGRYEGFVELSLELPDRMLHFVRSPKPAE